ncbi:uncharacterized protein LOC132556181 [Ylistrum balloti]|uniref:uncharacterized protein LOC132556181 n=1 Tax=Ylistrum balloti TaxID=509963 RepID=UPI0029059ACD|nr:uncharacterized protein LOC132556181 [Ylistrum balloti]
MAVSISSSLLQTSVKQLVTLCRRRLLERNLGQVAASVARCQKCSSTTFKERNRKKLYSISTAIAERADGIYDVPIIMRHVGDKIIQDENYDKLIPQLSEEEMIYMERLQDCESSSEVLHLLDIQPDILSSHAAALTLIKLKVLDRKRRDKQKTPGKSFVSKVIIQQLFGIAQRNIETLSDENLVELAKQFLEEKEPESEIKEFTLNLIQKKMEDGTLGKYAVFSLTEILQNTKHTDLLQDIWLHITSRYTELDLEDLLKYLDHVPANMDITDQLLKIIQSQLVKFGWQFGSRGIGKISANLSRLKCRNDTLAFSIAKWTLLHIHEIKTSDLLNVLTYFQERQQHNADLIHALEKYIFSKGPQVKNEILGQTLEYLCTIRYLSPVIMDAASDHFLKCGESYSATDLYLILKSFGFFGYEPRKQMAFFQAADHYIPKEFDKFQDADVYKLMCSFLWLGRSSSLLRGHARRKSWSMDRSDIKCLYWYRRAMVQPTPLTTDEISMFTFDIPMFNVRSGNQRNYTTLQVAKKALSSLLKLPVVDNIKVKSFLIDFMLVVDENKDEISRKVWSSHQDEVPKASKVILIKLHFPEHFCANTGELLGEYSMAKRYFAMSNIPYITLSPLKAGIEQASVEILQMHFHYKLHELVNLKFNPFKGVSNQRLLELWESSKNQGPPV